MINLVNEMAKQKQLEKPTITLVGCIRQLELINENQFMLKNGLVELIEAVEKGNLGHARKVIEVFKMKQVLENLTPNI